MLLTLETSDKDSGYLGAGGGGYYTPPSTAPIPGSPNGTQDWVAYTGPVAIERFAEDDSKSGCGGSCGGSSGTTVIPSPGGGGAIPVGGAAPVLKAGAETTLFSKVEDMGKNWLWLIVAAGVGYVVAKKM